MKPADAEQFLDRLFPEEECDERYARATLWTSTGPHNYGYQGRDECSPPSAIGPMHYFTAANGDTAPEPHRSAGFPFCG